MAKSGIRLLPDPAFFYCRYNFSMLAAAQYQIQNTQKDHCTDYGDNETGEVETRYAGASEDTHNPPSDDGADDAHNDVSQTAHLIVTADDHAGYPTRQRTKNDPT